MHPDDEQRAVLAAILRRIGADPGDARPLPGGSVNRTYRVARPAGDIVLRFPVDPRRGDEFPVEEWASRAAGRAGIPVADVVRRGVEGGVPFLVSVHVDPHPDPVADPWTRLGLLARAVGSVPLDDAPHSLFSRFGTDLAAAWDAHVRYDLAALDDGDPLLRDGAYDPDALPWLRARFASLARTPFELGFAHGDLAPRNLISRGRDAVPVLIDWGAATTGPTPWTDARRVTEWALVDGTVALADLEAFRDAAGLGGDDARRTLIAMTALHLVDTTRWARERRPDLYPGYAARCRAGLRRLAAEE
jgi:Ser/Thr protein kinase RdoA (MazF antagonist)